MNHEDYEQNKQECWEEYVSKHGMKNAIPEEPFSFTFDRAYALGKQFGNSEQVDADTVIQGWVARNGSGPNDLGLHIYTVKPDRMKNRREWNGHGEISYLIDYRLFPDLTWESDPEPVEIIIKRKKK